MGWYCTQCGQRSERAGTCTRDATGLAPIGSHDLLGRDLGDYIVLAGLGGGSFGQVYRAVHARSGAVVAIKLLQQPIDDAQRVVTEARAAAMIRHPNAVAVYDLGLTSDRRPFIVMQCLDGSTLRSHLPSRAPLDLVAPLAKDILRGLAAAHGNGVVHRDLKPDNVFVVKGNRAVIVDFGLAKLVADPRSPHLTATGESIGTPRYMAPEQILGKPVDGRADLYAVGVILYEALAGTPPFTGDSTFQLFDAHVHRPAPSLATARPDLSIEVCEVVDRALAKDPADRFADANAMRRALSAALLRPRRRRWPIYAVAGALAAAGTAALVMVATGDADRVAPVPPPPPPPPKLSAEYQRGLDAVAANVHLYQRVDVLRLICPIDQMLHKPGVVIAGEYRSYLERLHALLAPRVGGDLATACKPYTR